MYSIMKASILALIVIRGTREYTMRLKKSSELYNGIIKGGKKHDTVVTLSNKQPADDSGVAPLPQR